MLEAIRRFNPDKGVQLLTYARFWMQAFMMKFLVDNTRLVRQSRTRAGRLAFFRGLSVPSELSLDTVWDRDGSVGSLGDRLAHPGAPADVLLEQAESAQAAREKVASFAAPLGVREGAILRRRLLADAPESLRSLGKRFSVSGERIRQIERKLRVALRRKGMTVSMAAA